MVYFFQRHSVLCYDVYFFRRVMSFQVYFSVVGDFWMFTIKLNQKN